MSLKDLLGLESFNLSDVEIMNRITDARRKNIEILEFASGRKRVSINLVRLHPEGLMRDYRDYYTGK